MADYKQAWLDAEELLRQREAERDRLREALRRCERVAAEHPDVGPDGYEAITDITREALSRPTGGHDEGKA